MGRGGPSHLTPHCEAVCIAFVFEGMEGVKWERMSESSCMRVHL